MGADDLDRWRGEFPILESTVYMISNSLGAMPRRAAESLAEYARAWSTRGVRAWEERWWEMAREVGDRVGAIVGAPPGSVSMHENVTTAAMVALGCVPPRPGRNRIVCAAADFPSLIYLYRAQAPLGFELSVVPPEPDFTLSVERLADAIRMMNGTPSIPAYYAALPGLEIIAAIGVDRIRARSQQLTARIFELADRCGFPSIATRDPDRLAGTVAINPPEALAVSRALKARDYVVDFRPGAGIRISPHFYNTPEEIDRL